MVIGASKLTGSEKIRGFAPVTVMFAPMSMAAALVKARFVRGVVEPTATENVIVPLPACNVRGWPPSMVLLKFTLALLVLMVLAPIRLIGRANVTGVTVPEKVMFAPT